MNFQSITAFLFAGAVLVFGIVGSGDPSRFLDQRAMWIVLGGTVAAAAISFQVDRIFVLFKIFFRRVVQKKNEDYVGLISELMELAELHRNNRANFRARIPKCGDPFLREALVAVDEGVLEDDRLIRILHARVNTMYGRQSEEVIKFRAIGKYPPAFGLMGTTLSMISLLQRLGDPTAQKQLGPAMAMGLVATFYGLALANLVFNPVAESLADTTRRHRTRNLIIVEGVRLILEKINPIILAEELNSFLPPSERVDWKSVIGGSGKKPADKKAA